jgi:hypothetical protein
MEQVTITITGKSPLLMHADNIQWADDMEAWKNNPANKAKSKAGDDRTPPWRWIGCLNYDDPKTGVVTIPAEYIMRSIMGGAAEVPTGKGQKTFKSQSQSGLLCVNEHLPLLIKGKTIKMADVQKCMALKTFKEQTDAAKDLGFSLFVKRAKIGSSKHVRVRPRFDNWSIVGDIVIVDEAITKGILLQILKIAGNMKGIGDWRPGGPTPGPFGIFDAEVS